MIQTLITFAVSTIFSFYLTLILVGFAYGFSLSEIL